MEVFSLLASLKLDTNGFDRGLDTAEGKLNRLVGGIGRVVGAAAQIGTVVGGALGGAGIAAIKLAGDFEQTEVAFGTLLGSGEEAKAFLEDLKQFAANTPFELKGLADTSRLLVQMGLEGEAAFDALGKLGDAVSAVGGGEDALWGITNALKQMQDKGKLSAEEMQQLAERGIPAWQLLADAIGVSISEAMDMAQKGVISGTQAVEILITAMGERYVGASEAQAKTLLGLWSTFTDNIRMKAVEIGSRLIDEFDVKGKLEALIAGIEQYAPQIEGAINIVFSAIGRLAKIIGDSINLVKGWLGENQGSFKTWSDRILPSIQGLQTIFENVFNGIVQLWSRVLKPVLEDIVPIVAVIVQRMGPIMQSLGQTVGAAFTFLVDLWEKRLRPAWEFIAPVVKGIVDAVLIVLNNLIKNIGLMFGILSDLLNGDFVGAFEKAGEMVKNTFSALGQALFAIGKALIEGLINGINATFNVLKDTVTNMADSVVGWFKGVLGIASPSKVFAEFGKDTVQGYIDGLRSKDADLEKGVTTTAQIVEDTFSGLAEAGTAIDQAVAKLGSSIELQADGIAQKLELIDVAIDSLVANGIPVDDPRIAYLISRATELEAALKGLNAQLGIDGVFADVSRQGGIADRRATALGNSPQAKLEALESKISLLDGALNQLLDLNAGDDKLAYVVGRMADLQGEADQLKEYLDELAKAETLDEQMAVNEKYAETLKAVGVSIQAVAQADTAAQQSAMARYRGTQTAQQAEAEARDQTAQAAARASRQTVYGDEEVINSSLARYNAFVGSSEAETEIAEASAQAKLRADGAAIHSDAEVVLSGAARYNAYLQNKQAEAQASEQAAKAKLQADGAAIHSDDAVQQSSMARYQAISEQRAAEAEAERAAAAAATAAAQARARADAAAAGTVTDEERLGILQAQLEVAEAKYAVDKASAAEVFGLLSQNEEVLERLVGSATEGSETWKLWIELLDDIKGKIDGLNVDIPVPKVTVEVKPTQAKKDQEGRTEWLKQLTTINANDGPLAQFGKSLLNLAIEKIPLLGSALQGFAQGGPIGAVIAVFTELISKSEGFAKLITMVNKALEPVIAVLGRLVEALLPVIEPFLQIVTALTPIVEILVKIIAPPLQLLGKILSGVANLFIGIINGVIGVYNFLLGWLFGRVKPLDPVGSEKPGEEQTTEQKLEANRDEQGDLQKDFDLEKRQLELDLKNQKITQEQYNQKLKQLNEDFTNKLFDLKQKELEMMLELEQISQDEYLEERERLERERQIKLGEIAADNEAIGSRDPIQGGAFGDGSDFEVPGASRGIATAVVGISEAAMEKLLLPLLNAENRQVQLLEGLLGGNAGNLLAETGEIFLGAAKIEEMAAMQFSTAVRRFETLFAAMSKKKGLDFSDLEAWLT